MRYNPLSSTVLSHKTVRAGVRSTYTNLTQPPSGRIVGLVVLYQPCICPGGFIRAFCVAEPDYSQDAPQSGDKHGYPDTLDS